MRYLLDSHTVLWHRNDDDRLSRTASDLLENESVELLISEATFWEMSIKHAMGKLKLVGDVQSLRQEWIGQEAAQALGIDWKHILGTSRLPWLHRDPFDRMLVAQALAEDLTIVTADPNIPKYPGVKVLW